MSLEEVQEKYNMPPYKAVRMIKEATKIVDKLLTNATSFTQPYLEARMVIELADTILGQMIDIQNDVTDLRKNNR